MFAAIDSGVKGGVEHDASAVVYFGVQGWGERRYLYILDWEAVELGAASLEQWFVDVVVKLCDYMKTLRIARAIGPVYVEPAGLGELLIAKFPGDAIPIDNALVQRGKDLRALGCRAFDQWRSGEAGQGRIRASVDAQGSAAQPSDRAIGRLPRRRQGGGEEARRLARRVGLRLRSRL